jgi:uncharacterized protein (DUF2164 family)
MSEAKRNWDIISKEKRKEAINDIVSFFQDERDEEIGMIAAEDFLNHFLKNLGTHIYNKGVEDSSNFLKERFDGSFLDIDSIVKKTE